MPLNNPSTGVENIQLGGTFDIATKDQYFYDDFFLGSGGTGLNQYLNQWSSQFSGGATIVGNAGSVAQHPGIVNLNTFAASDNALMQWNSAQFTVMPSGNFVVNVGAQVNAIPDGTDTYIAYIGFWNFPNVTLSTPNEGFGFSFQTGIGGVIRAQTLNGGSASTLNTAVPQDNAWHNYQISGNKSAIALAIDGVTVASFTTRIPVSSTLKGCPVAIFRSAGVATRTLTIDYFHYAYTFGTTR